MTSLSLNQLIKDAFVGKTFSHTDSDLYEAYDGKNFYRDADDVEVDAEEYPMEGCTVIQAYAGTRERESTVYLTLRNESNDRRVQIALDSYTEIFFKD